jgi:hypothetical protein
MCVKDKAVVFVIFCLLSALLIISLFKYQTSVTHHYQRILVDLSLLGKNNFKINEQVLLSQLGLLRNYDQIIQATSDMDRVFQRLIKDKNEINTEGNHEINKHLTILDKEVSRLGIAVDHFLSANAVRNNSLIYLARQLRSFSEKNGAINRSKETHLAYRLMQEILLYNRWPEAERKAEIDDLSYQLQNSRLAPFSDVMNENVKLITDHSRVFAQYTVLADKELDIILFSNISETIALLRITVLNMHQQHVKLERKIDTVVWVLCILLILLQMFAIRSKVTKHLQPK